jgi:RimJ/RimL family protein N-acetyltransferase
MNVTLRSDIALLRPWRVEDANWYVEARDEEVFRWTTENRALTVEATQKAIQLINSGGNAYCFAVVNPKTDALVGNIALEIVDKQACVGELHYWLSPAGRGKGIATESVRLLSRWAFEELGLRRIIIKTLPGNVHSQHVAERVGFHRVEAPVQDNANVPWEWFEMRRAEP